MKIKRGILFFLLSGLFFTAQVLAEDLVDNDDDFSTSTEFNSLDDGLSENSLPLSGQTSLLDQVLIAAPDPDNMGDSAQDEVGYLKDPTDLSEDSTRTHKKSTSATAPNDN